jgi:two-component system chemotaxis sensor kinase CheA
MPATPKKIIIIEDDPMIGSMYKTKLEATGYEVSVFENGYDGLMEAKKGGFDLVMLDVMLPQLDGFTILDELRKEAKTKKTPIIIMTNLGTDEDVKKGKDRGATDYIVKSNFTPTEVADKIGKFLK